MAKFSLQGLKEDNDFLKRIKKAFDSYLKASQQKVEQVTVAKVKRVQGKSVVPVSYLFTGQQTVTLNLSAEGVVVQATLNKEDLALLDDNINPDTDKELLNSSIKEIARAIRTNQKRFEAKLERESQRKNTALQPDTASKTAPQNTAQQLKTNQDLETQLDNEYSQLAQQRDELQSRLDGLNEVGKS